MLIFDLETNGLLDAVTTIHCVSIYNTERDEYRRYYNDTTGRLEPADGTIEDALFELQQAEAICGHNVIAYDIPAIKKVYPAWSPHGKVFDTLVISRLIWTDRKDRDFALHRAGKLPKDFMRKGLLGKHSLQAWGFRLGVLKGDYGETTDWSELTQEMVEYCEQDVRVTVSLWSLIESQNYSAEAIDLELRIAEICAAMERHGFRFNTEAATELYARLASRRYAVEEELKRIFQPFYVRAGKIRKPKRDNARLGYTAGAEFCPIKLTEFNPGSRDHIADRLMKLHGWKPAEFTDQGKPKVDETILANLNYPEAKLLCEYLMLQKRLGQIAEGSNGWLKLARDGRIHGRVDPMGTRTGRMAHFLPNVAQVPSVRAEYGRECRELFMADDGWVLVGTDADGLELRDLAHYLHWYDGGAYAEIVLNGDKSKGTDIHTQNQKAIGLNSRDSAKTFIYALIYGAGDFKIGLIILEDMTEEDRRAFFRRHRTKGARENALRDLGRKARKKMYKRFPAIEKLTNDVKRRNKVKGYLLGLDGRRLVGSSDHAALNTLLQSAGAIAMKKAIVLFVEMMEKRGWSWGRDYAIVAMVHDEVQVTCRPEAAKDVQKLSVDAIRKAGEHFRMQCPLDGSSAVGRNWAETH